MSDEIEKTICIFDLSDYMDEATDFESIEIQAMFTGSGAFQFVTRLPLENVSPRLFHSVFKIVARGQRLQSKEAPLP